jgi:hypothetical protein
VADFRRTLVRFLIPKKTGPDQRTPAIEQAI